MVEPFEKFRMQERQLNRIANSLHSLDLSSYTRPRNCFHPCQRTIQALGGPDDLDGNALVRIQPQVQTRLQFLFGQERRTYDDRVRNPGFIPYTETAVRKYL